MAAYGGLRSWLGRRRVEKGFGKRRIEAWAKNGVPDRETAFLKSRTLAQAKHFRLGENAIFLIFTVPLKTLYLSI